MFKGCGDVSGRGMGSGKDAMRFRRGRVLGNGGFEVLDGFGGLALLHRSHGVQTRRVS